MLNLRKGLNENGAGSIRLYFWIIFGFSAIYIGYMIVPSYVGHKMLEREVAREATLAHHYSDAEMRKHILKKAKSWGVPIYKEDIEITRRRKTVAVEISYSIEFNFLNRYKRTVHYDITVVEYIKAK
ncbi:MAG: hypothetical protein KAS88_04795 [Deltaproteobacteria bacterium]|nr:hypothetical protein [Deltaproteobacteria bacterium]